MQQTPPSALAYMKGPVIYKKLVRSKEIMYFICILYDYHGFLNNNY